MGTTWLMASAWPARTMSTAGLVVSTGTRRRVALVALLHPAGVGYRPSIFLETLAQLDELFLVGHELQVVVGEAVAR